MHPKISFIGAGKVGNTLARLFHQNGYEIIAIYNRTRETALSLANQINATVANTIQETIDNADLICLTVADDAITQIAEALKYVDWAGKAVIHTSGSRSLDSLQSLAEKGAMVGSLHPAFPIANPDTAIQALQGASFAIEASHHQLQQWLVDFVTIIDGNPIIIPAGQKALYHAALVIASNYTVTLYATAQELLKSFNVDEQTVARTLLPLLNATVENIAQQGIPDALTGPLARADVGTLQSHLEAFNTIDADVLKQTYINLARLTYPMLEQRNIDIQSIEEQLREYK